jgi:hypothetical protein
MVGVGAKGLGAFAVVSEVYGWKEPLLPVFGFKPVERGQDNPESAVKVAKSLQEIGFSLMVRARLGFGIVCLLGLRLRRRIGAFNFMNSHGLPASIAGRLRLGRVRCISTGRCPTRFGLLLLLF